VKKPVAVGNRLLGARAGGAATAGGKLFGALPEGTAAIGLGLIANGLGAYLFLSLAGRGLGTEAFAPLSVMWALSFAVAPGLFLPLEQEISRTVAARRANNTGAAPVVRQAAYIGAALVAVVVVLTLASWPVSQRLIFDHQVMLMVGFLLILVGYALAHVVRGLLSGHGYFVDYSIYFGVEGFSRIAIALAFFLVGVHQAGPYGLALGLIPFLAVAAALVRPRALLLEGPPSDRGEVTASLGVLLVASLFTAGLMNAGPIAMGLLAGEGESEEAGRFLAGLVIARVPLFLFQAVQASLLPRLSLLAAGAQWAEFRSALARLMSVVGLIGGVASVAAFLVGPWAVSLLFGADFTLSNRDLGLLAISSAAFMAAVALGQALIALGSQNALAVAWGFGVATFLAIVALGSDLYLRVELGLVLGTLVVSVALAAMLGVALREARRVTPTPLIS